MIGYGNTAPYGELAYKGEIYPEVSPYFLTAKSLLLEQYKKNYINSGSTVTTIVSTPALLVADYPTQAVNLMLDQYRKEYING